VMTISDLSQSFVVAAVDESDVGRVRVGQAAIVALDAFPDERFEGQVLRIASRGVNISNVVTFEVRIAVHGENQRLLRPEMTASVQIRVEARDRVLLVPSNAVVRKDECSYVRVARPGGRSEERAVELGISDGTSQEIRSGLAEGESVLVEQDTSPSGAPRPAKKKFWNLSG
jgi:multidrug efflux pump subunit AcrA (membrane-fusion protein)